MRSWAVVAGVLLAAACGGGDPAPLSWTAQDAGSPTPSGTEALLGTYERDIDEGREREGNWTS
jgi:hypothetical protein